MTSKDRLWSVTASVALSIAASGCSAKDEEVKIDAAVSVIKPKNWQTECVGRWLVDVPLPIEFGSSYVTTGEYPKFRNYAPRGLRESTRSRGSVSIGPTAFTESDPLPAEVPFQQSTSSSLSGLRYMALRLSQSHYERNYPDELYKQLIPRTETQTAWAGPGRFQLALLSSDDKRGRFYWKDHRQTKTEPPKEGERAEPETPPSGEALARETLANLVPRYTAREPGQMPSTPGICTPHGFFSDPPAGTERDSRVSVSFVDPRYANLAVHVEIATRMPHNETALIPTEDIRKAITPWDAAEEMAREHKKRCAVALNKAPPAAASSAVVRSLAPPASTATGTCNT